MDKNFSQEFQNLGGVLSYFEKFLSHSIDLVKQYAASFDGRVVAKQKMMSNYMSPIMNCFK